MTLTTSNMFTTMTMTTNTNANVFPVKHNTNTKTNILMAKTVVTVITVVILLHVRVDDLVNDFLNDSVKFDKIGSSAEIGRSGEIGEKTVVTVVILNDFVNDFVKLDKIGRSAEIGRSGDNAMPPPRPRQRPWQRTLKLMWQRTLKLTDNAMKLMEKDVELFRGIFNFVNKPPKPPHFDEIVLKFKFNAMKLIENKSVVLSWVYLQPFCSTFFTLFSIFISGATKTRQPSSRVFFLSSTF